MLKLEKLISLVMAGNVFVKSLLIKRFLLSMAAILVLSAIIGVVIAALLMGGLYLAYRLMLDHGMTVDAALLTTGSIGVACLLVCVAIISYRIRQLRNTLKPKPALLSRINEVAEAFINGLLTNPERKSTD